MSQIYKRVTSGALPPDVAISFTTDDGSATPAANILLVTAIDTIEDEINGIRTVGGGTDGTQANEVRVELSNRATGTVQTVGAISDDLITMDVSTITPALAKGIFRLTVDIVGGIDADNTGASWHIEGTLFYDGVGGFATLGTPTRTMNGNAAVFDVSQVTLSFSGSDITVEVTGLAGKTIEWTGLLTYLFGAIA